MWIHGRIMLAARLLCLAGEVPQDLDGAGRLANPLFERLSLLPGQFAPNFGDASFEKVGGLVEDARPRHRRAEPPAAIGLLSGADRRIDVIGAGRGEEPDDLVPIGWVAVIHRVATGGRSPLASDVVAVGLDCLGGLGPLRGRNHLYSPSRFPFRSTIDCTPGPSWIRPENEGSNVTNRNPAPLATAERRRGGYPNRL